MEFNRSRASKRQGHKREKKKESITLGLAFQRHRSCYIDPIHHPDCNEPAK